MRFKVFINEKGRVITQAKDTYNEKKVFYFPNPKGLMKVITLLILKGLLPDSFHISHSPGVPPLLLVD